VYVGVRSSSSISSSRSARRAMFPPSSNPRSRGSDMEIALSTRSSTPISIATSGSPTVASSSADVTARRVDTDPIEPRRRCRVLPRQGQFEDVGDRLPGCPSTCRWVGPSLRRADCRRRGNVAVFVYPRRYRCRNIDTSWTCRRQLSFKCRRKLNCNPIVVDVFNE